MGLYVKQIEWLVGQIREHKIHGSVLQIGKVDFFISVESFQDMLCDLGIAERIDYNGVKEIQFADDLLHKKYLDLIASGEHINKVFNNTRFTRKYPLISDKFFFLSMGFDECSSIDLNISRDNADFQFDLNKRGLSSAVKHQFDLVIDCGTMEHVFDVRQVMENITGATKTDGAIIHVMPGNNTFDHGFFQFSPTLFSDYYSCNRYDILDLSVFELSRNCYSFPDTPFDERWDTSRFFKYDPWLMAKSSFGKLAGDRIYFTHCCVRKTKLSLENRIPIQYLFTPGAKYISPWKE